MTLYELTQDYMLLMDMAMDPDTDDQAFVDTLESLTGEIEDKADNYAKVIRTLEGQAKAIKEELDRLASRKAAIEKHVSKMKESLQRAMVLTGKPKFKTNLFSFNIQKNPASVVLDTEEIPEEYLTFRDPVVNKTAIKDAIKDGKDLTGIAHLEQSESLRIR